VAIAESDIRRALQDIVGAVLLEVDLTRHLLEALLWYVSLLERVLWRERVLNVAQQRVIVLGPVLLSLFEKEARLDLWILFL